VHTGSPPGVLAAAAAEAHLLVIGARDHRWLWARVFGTVGTTIARRPPCAVVVVHDGHPGRVRRGVLVGVDDTAFSQPALRFAFQQASLHGWPLTVLHVAPDGLIDQRPDDRELERFHLASALAGETEMFPDVNVTASVVRGEPATCLLRAGAAMNLVVVGAHHGRPASDLLRGSVVVPVVERARSDVAIVPSTRP
jgi:nucleotide-binding universal stress UspA family protein